MTRVAFLSPSFYPYRVPVFDELSRHFGGGFIVVASRFQRHPNSIRAQEMGEFSRIVLGGRHFQISRRHIEGVETPFGVTFSPALATTLWRARPNAVVSTNFGAWTLTALAMGYPTVISWEGTEHTERTVGRRRLALRRWMARKAKAFVVNGTLSRRYLTECLGVPAHKISEGGMSAERPPEDFLPIGARSVAPDRKVRFLFVGRLIQGKGVDHLAAAASVLRRQLSNEDSFEVVVLGDGPERLRLAELAGDLAKEHRFSLLGAVAPTSVWAHYVDAHVFVLPTLQDNWPLVVAEAMSMGLPILLSNRAGSVPDLVVPGENGYVFDPEDHDELASKMRVFVDQPELVQVYGARSLELVRPYTPERVARVFIEAIEGVVH